MNKNIQLALEKLASTYNIIGNPFYLSQTLLPNGSSTLYNYIKSVYKEEFGSDDKIIFVQDSDSYDYEEFPGQAVALLQKYLVEINIDNFFVMVVSGNSHIDHELEQLCQQYKLAVPIQHQWVENVDFDRSTTQSDTFCMLPWVHLHIETTGKVLPCCIADPNFPVGNVKHNSIDEILNSERIKKIRRNMMQGKKSIECARCYNLNDYKKSLKNRHGANKQFGHYRDAVLANTNTDGHVSNHTVKYIDIRMNNICNLKCRTCDGHWSSQLAQEEKTVFDFTKNADSILTVDQRRAVFPAVLKHLPTVDTIYFAGGEPLWSIEHYKILDKLLELGRTDVELVYNTNFTKFTFKTNNVLDYWKKFSRVRVGASLDGHGSTIEYVRHGTQWADIEANLLLLKQQTPHVELRVTSTVSLLSVLSIIELQKMWHTENKLSIDCFSIGFVFDDLLNLQVLPTESKTEISNSIAEHIDWLITQPNTQELIESWQDIDNFMWKDNQTHMLKKMWLRTKQLDSVRGECFEKVFPNLYRNIKSYV